MRVSVARHVLTPSPGGCSACSSRSSACPSIIFLVLRLLPGNAVTAALGVSAGLLTHAQLVALDHYYGIGQPFFQQFGSWLGSVLTGNLGVSLSSRTSVASLVGSALPVTLELAIAVHDHRRAHRRRSSACSGRSSPGRVVDDIGRGVSVVGLGVPSFVIGTGLVTFLASVFHYFPSSEGFASITQNPWLNVQQIFFPALTLGLGIGAAIMRTTRAAMLEVIGLNYARTARGKGLSKRVGHLEAPIPRTRSSRSSPCPASSSATCSAAR